jgi:hypothetical protein
MLLTGILPGVCEEVSHRGLLLRGFAPKLGIMRAILVSSLMFGFMHMNIAQFLYTAILGYFMALSVMATRSLWTGIIIHFMNNGLNTYFSYAQANGWPLGNILDPLFQAVSQAYGLLIMGLVVFGAYYIVTNILHKFARDNYRTEGAVHIAAQMLEPGYKQEFNPITGEPLSIEEQIERNIRRMDMRGKHAAMMYYMTPPEKPEKMTAGNKALLFTVLALGAIVTVFTLIWGMM